MNNISFKLVFSGLILSILLSCKLENKKFDLDTFPTTNEVSIDSLLPTSTTNLIIEHAFYKLSYNEKHEQAEWVAYILKKENLKNNYNKRQYFDYDEKVKTKSADWRNYKNSGYDKGHLCPAGDMRFSKTAYEETFFTSNISPQNHEFNSGVWNRLEQKTRYWAEKYGEVYVVSGGVLSNGLKTIGREKVTVPNYYYKILARKNNGTIKIIAFLVPHKNSSKPLYTFVSSVDEIEEITQIDFFSKIEDNLENRLEANKDYKDWSFN